VDDFEEKRISERKDLIYLSFVPSLRIESDGVDFRHRTPTPHNLRASFFSRTSRILTRYEAGRRHREEDIVF
jgi:hypothetical protein